ncbi:hypothetical protein CAPTEDRAFT_175014 [Capitella teleta]|uniref:Rab-GAP TBC domain-containing protein n=1 Tax=Capitella teleta TaxID=283909 RepID=R7V0N7_CAPTE|nr:hypothetical protein CAPTEDRAFT_175014 [Capitella teleta]|eukprot:ELU09246.1 hypothetical protein CAPTEDRAFT_175014 [Capitella teleta]
MSFTDLLKKATNFLGIGSPETARPPPLDGEIIFCKNNVCVHPPASLSTEIEHYPGYLNIRSQEDKVLNSTLILTWIPNSTLKKNPRSIENSPGRAKISPRRSPRQEFAKELSSTEDVKPEANSPLTAGHYKSQASDSGFVSQDLSISSEGDARSFDRAVVIEEEQCSETDSESTSTDEQLVALLRRSTLKNPAKDSVLQEENRRRTSSGRSVTSVTSIEMDGDNLHDMRFPANAVMFSSEAVQSPGGTVHRTAKDQLCGVFSVDLGQMRSLRIFYTDHACTSGQLVIASRESQYKILNFHHGGLERLADTLSHWKFLAQPLHEKQRHLVDKRCRHFSVIRPYLTDEQRHPEEGAHETVNEETWRQHMNEQGQIEDDFHLRRAIFFAGLDPSLRHEMWPFLLHYYPYNSTHEEREQIRNDRYIVYQNLRRQRESMSPESAEEFWRNVQCTVEKDVVRTDRTHVYFKGDDNPNIQVLKNVLLSYAVAHPCYGYTQGMSDLLAPILVEVQNEVDAYWCFVGLMQRTIFVSSPKDVDMDKQLSYLQELLRLLLPHFYQHMTNVQDGMELLFVHRWILLCFKREFPEADALRMWEACWAHFQTDYFHLFICAAIIAVYGEDVVQQKLPADEMLLHFSSLSMHMSGEVVLRKARGLLHKFRTLEKIPCTLEGICMLCGSGMWDSGHVPTVECSGNHEDTQCPFGGK